MRSTTFGLKSIIAVASLAALSFFARPAATLAADATISSSPGTAYYVAGAYSDSGVTLAEDVAGTLYHTTIKISDQNLLRVGWMIKVNNEYMLIDELTEGDVGQPDTMVVERPMNGTTADPHPNGTIIMATTINIAIWAKGVTDSSGLGAFSLAIVLPPEVEYIGLTADSQWLSSTGRTASCLDPSYVSGVLTIGCLTLGATPLGPTGSGVIARLRVLPSQDFGISTMSLTGSRLTNISGGTIPATVSPMKIRTEECPDTNLDGNVNVGDDLLVAKNDGDTGRDSGAVLASAVDASQTVMQISDQSLLSLNATASVGAEQMIVQLLHEGTPDSMTATRGANHTPAKAHDSGSHIYVAMDPGSDGKFGYTAPRDVDHTGAINVGDSLIIARTEASAGGQLICPDP